MGTMPRIPYSNDEDDELFSDEELLEDAELARIERRDREATAADRALMNTGAAKMFKAVTEAPSYRGIPKVAKGEKAKKAPAPAVPGRAPRTKKQGKGRGR